MFRIYYNPAIRTDLPRKEIANSNEIDSDNAFYTLKSKSAYSSKAEALTQEFEGFVRYFENGRLYEGFLIQEWSYEAVTTTAMSGGINWDTYYAVTEELLREFVSEHYNHTDSYKAYMNEYGLYEIQVHYSGRTR